MEDTNLNFKGSSSIINWKTKAVYCFYSYLEEHKSKDLFCRRFLKEK